MTATLTREQFDELVDIAADFDDDAAWRTDYSGRGMYGETCLAVVTSMNPYAFAFNLGAGLAATGEAVGIDAETIMDRIRHDSMGKRVVLYWPTITVEP